MIHRFVHLDPPGLIRFWKIVKFGSCLSSGGLHHNPIDDDTSGHVFPKCDQQLSRHRDDRCFLKTAAAARGPFLEPVAERRLWLMTKPEPGELDQCCS
jgi:hypothetical protein